MTFNLFEARETADFDGLFTRARRREGMQALFVKSKSVVQFTSGGSRGVGGERMHLPGHSTVSVSLRRRAALISGVRREPAGGVLAAHEDLVRPGYWRGASPADLPIEVPTDSA